MLIPPFSILMSPMRAQVFRKQSIGNIRPQKFTRIIQNASNFHLKQIKYFVLLVPEEKCDLCSLVSDSGLRLPELFHWPFWTLISLLSIFIFYHFSGPTRKALHTTTILEIPKTTGGREKQCPRAEMMVLSQRYEWGIKNLTETEIKVCITRGL